MLCSGGAILTGASLTSTVSRPVIGVDFELTGIDINKNPKNVGSITIDFNKLQITPKYLDTSRDISVTVELRIDNHEKTTRDAVITNIENGQTVEVKDQIEPVTKNNLDFTDQDYASGDVVIRVEHPNITDEYTQSFSMSGSEIPASVTEDPWGDDASWTVIENWDRPTGSWGNEWSFDAGSWSIVSNPQYDNHNVGKHVTESSNYDAYNTGSSLNYYPDPRTDRVRARMRMETAKSGGDGYRVGVEVGYNNSSFDYEIELDSRQSEFKVDSGSGAFEDKSKSFTWSGSTWYGVYFDHDGSNYTCALCDETDSLLESITGTVDLQELTGATGVSATTSATTTSDGNDVYWGTIEAAKNQTTYELS